MLPDFYFLPHVRYLDGGPITVGCGENFVDYVWLPCSLSDREKKFPEIAKISGNVIMGLGPPVSYILAIT